MRRVSFSWQTSCKLKLPLTRQKRRALRMELTHEKSWDYLIPYLIPNSEPEEPLTRYGLFL